MQSAQRKNRRHCERVAWTSEAQSGNRFISREDAKKNSTPLPPLAGEGWDGGMRAGRPRSQNRHSARSEAESQNPCGCGRQNLSSRKRGLPPLVFFFAFFAVNRLLKNYLEAA
jgi:hypothetical protein